MRAIDAWWFALAVVGATCVTACASPPPQSTEVETALVRLDACFHGEPACIKRGAVSVTDGITPASSLHLDGTVAPASIELPIIQPANVSKLLFVTLGTTASTSIVRIDVGATSMRFTPNGGPYRNDLELAPAVDAATLGNGATLRVTVESGFTDLVYVVGRWNH